MYPDYSSPKGSIIVGKSIAGHKLLTCRPETDKFEIWEKRGNKWVLTKTTTGWDINQTSWIPLDTPEYYRGE